MRDTKIAWTKHTFNIWQGCQKVSAGCDNCYAELQSNRFTPKGTASLWGAKATYAKRSDEYWREPLQWNEKYPGRVFCGSMCDVFDLHGYEDQRVRLYELIKVTPNLTWLLLTKRPQNISRFLPDDWGNGYPNVWLGTSVENNEVTSRIDILRKIPATKRFISFEPLIGDVGTLDFTGIDWAIIGGESGCKAIRPMKKEWALSIVEQAIPNNVAVFFKQWGNYDEHGKYYQNKNDIPAMLDGKSYLNFP
jgi:protein gp37